MSASFLIACFLLAVPAAMLAFAFVPRSMVTRCAAGIIQGATLLSHLALLVALVAPVALLSGASGAYRFAQVGPFRLGSYYDALSAMLLVLVAFIGTIVMRYAKTYLAGDPNIGRFFKWLCVTTGAALCLVVAGNLVLFFLAWMAMSLSLHKLLTFYSDRPAALLAARKKFVISRLGDLCLLGVIALTYRTFGSWDFDALFAGAHRLAQQGAHGHSLQLIALLLVAGAMLKSAQFPFHSWLPDTMETPTPVSALMHAGIINAGGFLIIRLSPLVTLSPVALDVLAVVGAVTALFAGLVMTTQTSVKRALAFSTVAQMGFMMLQCGLGAFSVAALHIVAHSLYKAHAFLSSGSVVANPHGAPALPAKREPSVLLSLGAFAFSLLVVLGVGTLMGLSLRAEPGAFLLGGVLVVALARLLQNLWSTPSPTLLSLGAGLVAGLSALYFGLHLTFSRLLAPSLPAFVPSRGAVEDVLLVLLALGALLAAFAPRLSALFRSLPISRALYVHAANGFYLNTFANRLAARF